MLNDEVTVTLKLTQSNLYMLRSILADKLADVNQILDQGLPACYSMLRRQIAGQARRIESIMDQLPEQVNGWYLLPFDENGDPLDL